MLLWPAGLCLFRSDARPQPDGLFGKSLTVSGLESARFNIGDRLAVGDVVLEVSAPRNPCSTFAAAWANPLGQDFLRCTPPGPLCARAAAGRIETGMSIAVTPFAGTKVQVTELTHDYKRPSRERMRCSKPTSPRSRRTIHRRLSQGDLLD